MNGAILPADADRATLVGRIWRPDLGGPSVVCLSGDRVVDVTRAFPTMAELCATPDPAAAARSAAERGEAVCMIDALLANAQEARRAKERPYPLAPVDLQAIKAAGVTFPVSMLERVIEEQARGDPARAGILRAEIAAAIGGALETIRPGSDEAARLKALLGARGAWSQYLEVGLGPDAEIFTKAQPLAAVGLGADIGIHPISAWNNPEPEIVLVVSPEGEIVGASLGNDVNLRDVEGRSALLLGKAKDNNASAAIGPFIRLFDAHFTLRDVRVAEVELEVLGEDGFRLEGRSSMRRIARDPEELVAQAFGAHHQYPDGFVLYCGTMFAPTADRGAPGKGFTHDIGDVVTIRSERLGALVNRVRLSTECAPWTFGARALIRHLARRGVL